ncbi:MAG: dockerin type I repeat-containing protein [Bacilli bacterium]|nr:dockerin type I repeat-containing protein [Bacilli bacterium]
MKKFIGKGNGLFNTTNIIVGTFLLLVVIVIGVLISSSSSYALDTSNLTYGDLDCDGNVTSADAITLARTIKGMVTLSENQKIVADLNQDGKVDEDDLNIIVRYMVNYDSMSLPYTEIVSDIKYGDINLDGNVTSADDALLAGYIDGSKQLTDDQKVNADLNLDGKIDNCDAIILAQYLTSKIELPYIVMATPNNATPGNATPGNATPGNATPGNATPGNAALNDNVMMLLDFGFNSNNVTSGERIDLILNTSGACKISMRLYFVNSSNGYSFSADVKSLNENYPYFIVPENVPSGEYYLAELIIVGLNSDNTTFTTHHSSIDSSADVFHDFVGTNERLHVVSNNNSTISIGNVSLSNSTAKIGEKINVSIENKDNLFSLVLLFKSGKGNEFKVHLNRFNIKYEGAYFVIPSNVTPDNYYVYQMEVSDDEKTVIYTKDQNLNSDISLEVLSNEEKTYTYSNVYLSEEIINEIKNAPNDTEIVIDASINTIVNESVFNAIKGTNKKLIINYYGNEIVFDGMDIKEVKTIDVSIYIINNFESIDDDMDLSSIVENGVVIDLSSNGTLPGKAIYRIYADDTLKEIIGTKKIYLYYYDEDNNNFSLIEKNIKLNDNYYEFEIEHNSKYILTKNKIDSQYVVKLGNNVVHFQNGDMINLLLIVGGIALIAVVLVIILLVKRKKTNKQTGDII